jgi:hypothetical protein
MKVKGKFPKGRPRSRWEEQVRKNITQKERRRWGEKLRRRSTGKTETDRKAWLSDSPKIWKCLRKKIRIHTICMYLISIIYK